MGMEESAKGFDIDLKTMKIEYNWTYLAPVFIGFQKYWWNFSYDRNLILGNTFYAFIISFIIFVIGFKQFASAYFPSDQLGLKVDTALSPTLNRTWKPTVKQTVIEQVSDRFKITFFYTALIFFGWKMDHSKLKYRTHPWTALVIYLIYIIGLIHLAYLAGFVIAR